VAAHLVGLVGLDVVRVGGAIGLLSVLLLCFSSLHVLTIRFPYLNKSKI